MGATGRDEGAERGTGWCKRQGGTVCGPTGCGKTREGGMAGVHNLDEFVRQALTAHGYGQVKPLIVVVTQTTSVTYTFTPTGDGSQSRTPSAARPETVLRIEVVDADGVPQQRFLLTASVDLQGALTLTALQTL
jgi:hypothetical protein